MLTEFGFGRPNSICSYVATKRLIFYTRAYTCARSVCAPTCMGSIYI
jgi:hypothetical protein